MIYFSLNLPSLCSISSSILARQFEFRNHIIDLNRGKYSTKPYAARTEIKQTSLESVQINIGLATEVTVI